MQIANSKSQTKVCATSKIEDLKSKISERKLTTCATLLANKFYGQAKGLISTGQLSTLLHLHFQPINLVVYQESRGQD